MRKVKKRGHTEGLGKRASIGKRTEREALNRVGKNPEDRCRWFLRFASLNLDQLDTQVLQKLGEEFSAIETFANMGFMNFKLDKAFIREKQEWVQGQLRLLKNGNGFFIELTIENYHEFKRGSLSVSLRVEVDSYKHVFSETLKSMQDKFRACQICGEFFVARKRQGYCTPTCSQTSRTRRWRANNPEKVRGYAQEARLRKRKEKLVKKIKRGK